MSGKKKKQAKIQTSRKYEKASKLNMPFDEAMRRLIRVGKEEVDKAISRTKKRSKKK